MREKPLAVAAFIVAAATSVVSAGAGTQSAARPTQPLLLSPNVAFSDGPPHAGKVFLGVVISFGPPEAFKVQRVWCRATLGGRFVRHGEGKALVGGRFIPAIMRRYYNHQTGGPYRGRRPRLSALTCAWKLPPTAAGKLLSLAPPGCSDACQDWGVTIWYQRYDYETRKWSGQGDANYYAGTWRVRP